jgi:ADP-ribosyl-[dinitrogen reductase] hydrolase
LHPAGFWAARPAGPKRGGDADTTGAIAGMLAGALYGRTALPGRWLRVLDAAARERCIAQSRLLLAVGRRD